MESADTFALSTGISLGVVRVLQPDPAILSAAAEPLGATMLGGERVQTIRQSVTTIGRDLRNAIVLLDPSVSRQHARIVWDHGRWTVENCSRRNAVWVDEHELLPGDRLEVHSGDRLRLGNTLLQLLAPAAADSAAANMPWPATVEEAEGGIEELNDIELLDPGVTIRFALSGQFARRSRWVLLGAGVGLFLISALLTMGTAALVGHQALEAHGVIAVLAAVTIPLVPALGAALLVGAMDRYEREPIVVLIGAFAWGALIAIPAALVLERWLDMLLRAASLLSTSVGAHAGPAILRQALLQGFSAGLTEETVKGAGLLLLMFLLFDEFDNVTDGIIYGVLIGAGFAMVENFVYFAGTTRADLGELIVGRVILGWLSHSTFTALFGAGLGLTRETRNPRVRLLAPVIGFAAAVALHTLFDAVDFAATAAVQTPHIARTIMALAIVAVIVDFTPVFAAQVVLLRMVLRALRREASTIREYLADEVPAGVVTPDEYATVQQAAVRARIEHSYLLGWGPRAYLAARALHQTATGLAFRKWHVAMGDRPKTTPHQPEEIYRQRMRRLRRTLALLVRPRPPQSIAAPTQPAAPWVASPEDDSDGANA